MREALDQWDFVIASYAVTLLAIAMLTGWCWSAMRRAEKRREDVRSQRRDDCA